MNPEANPMPLVSECNPVDAVECPCCLTVFRVRTLMTDGNGRLMGDGCDETNPNTVTPETTTSSKSNTETIVKCDDLPNSNLSECEIQLLDGRHINCLTVNTTYRGGLSCDWEHASKTETETK